MNSLRNKINEFHLYVLKNYWDFRGVLFEQSLHNASQPFVSRYIDRLQSIVFVSLLRFSRSLLRRMLSPHNETFLKSAFLGKWPP